MSERTFTRAEVAELMWRYSRPWLDADRWSTSYATEQTARHREWIERDIDEYLAKQAQGAA